MTTITLHQLTFSYEAQSQPLFKQLNLQFDTSWRLALVGRNGAGKTTFLQLLNGQLPYHGQINFASSCRYFPQTVTDPHQTVSELIAQQEKVEPWQVQRELDLLQIKKAVLTQPFDTLSGGEQTKVLLACAFADETAFPLLDEPTNHLDLASRQLLATYLRQKRQGYFVTSHDRHFLNQVSNHVCAIERQQIIQYQGNFAVYEREKQARDQFELAKNETLKHEITRLKISSREKRDWSYNREKDKFGDQHNKGTGSPNRGFIGARAARVMKKAKNVQTRMDNQIAAKSQLLKNIETVDPLTLNYQPDYHRTLFTLQEVTLSYGTTPLFTPVTLTVKRGDRIAILGPNGMGKYSLLLAMQQRFPGKITGLISSPQQLATSVIQQKERYHAGTIPDFIEQHQLNQNDFLNNLHKLGVERKQFDEPIANLSLGQQKKIQLAASQATPAACYLWDEPLNYLDVFNQEQLETMLAASNATMIFVEHDQAFIDHVATKTYQLKTSSRN